MEWSAVHPSFFWWWSHGHKSFCTVCRPRVLIHQCNMPCPHSLLSWTAGSYSSTTSCLGVSCQSRLPGINIALPKPFDMHHHAHSSVGTVLIMLHQGTHGRNVITRQVLHTHSRCLKGNLPTACCSNFTQPSKDNNHNAGPASACVCIGHTVDGSCYVLRGADRRYLSGSEHACLSRERFK